ncbi:MAG: hypothetical protein OWT27_02575, partial [Firmicutes bacterium]|nr:hypothetical protein [Bacillota bacterium]
MVEVSVTVTDLSDMPAGRADCVCLPSVSVKRSGTAVKESPDTAVTWSNSVTIRPLGLAWVAGCALAVAGLAADTGVA